MKAIVYTRHGLPPEDPQSLIDHSLAVPEPGEHDLRVQVRAIAVNPVDAKLRRNVAPDGPRVLGWDAVGRVDAIGSDVTRFKVGDEVYFAGSIARPGAYAEYTLVDERVAGAKPRTLSDAEAAALPLTTITAWELLFDRLRVPEDGGDGQALLVTGAAGGVGSMLVQLARQLTKLRVIGTASRPETAAWIRGLGAHDVIDHTQPLVAQLHAIGVPAVTQVASLTHTDRHYAELVEALAPQGQFALIDDPASLDALPLKRKSISLHWELMFTRPLFGTPDLVRQHQLLSRVAQLVDAGTLRSTLGAHFGSITAENLRRAHALIESGQARGKVVLEGF